MKVLFKCKCNKRGTHVVGFSGGQIVVSFHSERDWSYPSELGKEFGRRLIDECKKISNSCDSSFEVEIDFPD